MNLKRVLRFGAAALITVSTTLGAALAAGSPVTQKVEKYNETLHSAERADENALSVCTELIEADDRLGLDAKILTIVCDTEREKIEKIYNWIVENVKYDSKGSARPLTAYIERKGNDEALSNLMTAMLRYLDIPAKTVSGHKLPEGKVWQEDVFSKEGNPLATVNHTWTEVFFDGAWHTYDVVCGAEQQSDKAKYKDSDGKTFAETHLLLDTDDKEIFGKATFLIKTPASPFEPIQNKILKQVLQNNRNRHDLARDDETALAVYSETANTYSGPWDHDLKHPSNFLYQDPSGAIAALSQELTKDCKTDREKAKKIHDWVADNIYYNYDNMKAGIFCADDSEAHLTLSDKIGVCSGYSCLMTALLREAGIPAKQVHGYTVKDEDSKWSSNMFDHPEDIVANHSWTEAFFEGSWHTYDPTWDSQNRYENGQKTKKPSRSKYCDISIATLSKTHYITDNRDGTLPRRDHYVLKLRQLQLDKTAVKQ